MKLRHIAIGLMMLFCLNVFGQQQKTVPMTVQPQKTEMQALEETVSQLQAENQAMQKQMETFEKEVELYRNEVRVKNSEMNTNMALWFSVLTIVMAILGVAIPLILNKKNERIVEKLLADARDEAKDAAEQAKQAKQAVADIGELKKHVDAIEKRINEDALAAEKAAKEAKASQMLAQALSEKDLSRAIELYTRAIELKPDFAAAYNNRGIVRSDIGDVKGAMRDYDMAIRLDSEYSKAYNNRADLWLEMGETGKAMDDINSSIEIDNNRCVSFVTRGEIYIAMGDTHKAISDFNHAISINDGVKEAYENRAKCYRKLAEEEQDPVKKAEWIAKAEADEQKAASLK